jgi:endoglucanase
MQSASQSPGSGYSRRSAAPCRTGYLGRIEEFIFNATSRGFLVIIDLHNYSRYATGAVSASGVETATFTRNTYGGGLLNASHLVDVWTKLADEFKGHSQVAFGIMNEPHDFIGEYNTWFDDLQNVVTAIRSTGAKQLVLVPNSRGSDVDHWFAVQAAREGVRHNDSELRQGSRQ